MADLIQCLQNAMDAGDLDKERGQKAQERFRELVDRNKLAGLPEEDARVMAMDEMFDGLAASAAKKRHVALRQIKTKERNLDRYGNLKLDDPHEADLVVRDLEKTEREWHGLRRQFWAGIGDFLENFHTNVIGQVQRKAMLVDVVRELHGEATGNVAAEAIAKSVRQAFERARALFNAWGGDIGKLDDFGLPHSHNDQKIKAAGREAWSQYVYDRADWSRIVNYKTGKPFAVAKGAKPFREDAFDFLSGIYDNITTNGWSKREPSFAVGGKALYNTRSESRVLHFASADDWLAYNELFGAANPFDAVVHHIDGMARDIALMRNWGPNPKLGLQHALQVMEKKAMLMEDQPGDLARTFVHRKGIQSKAIMEHLTGGDRPANEFWARFFSNTRRYLQSAQLGAAILSQLTDHATSWLAAHAVGMNPTGPLQSTIKSIVSTISKQDARDMGWILDTWADAAAGHARYLGDVWNGPVVKRVNSVVLRASALNFMTDHCRAGVATAFMNDLAGQAEKSFADLHPELRRLMDANSIGPKEWDALRDPTTMFTTRVGGKLISPTVFLHATKLPRHEAEDIATKYSALIEQQLEYAIPTASIRAQAQGNFGPAGTIVGELGRSMGMYKNYSLSLMFNQVARVMAQQGNWNRFTAGASFVGALTAIGALSVQLKQMAAGHDPEPMNDAKFWGQAFFQGGGLGIFGDLIRATKTRSGFGLAQTITGPVVSAGQDLGSAVVANTASAISGKPMHFGRDFVNLGRRYNPTSTLMLGGVLPLRLAMDRLVWDQLQLMLDPDAIKAWNSAVNRLRAEYSTQFFWSPGSVLPNRAPDLANMTGGNTP